ncbi:MAG: OmpA family protein, partial [Bacteroidota bacterium]
SKTELNRLVAFLQANPHITIELEGHTDQLGPEDYNYNLSVKRAQAIYTYLITAGISPDKLSYKGYGRSRPIAPNDSPINRQLNRRTAFRITSIHTSN